MAVNVDTARPARRPWPINGAIGHLPNHDVMAELERGRVDRENLGSVEERIIGATIQCIERVGVHDVTVRMIGKEAGVNSAAINYYFRSKDRLLDIVLERTFAEGTSKALAELDQYVAESDFRSALRRLLLEQAAGTVAHPRLARWHLDLLVERRRRGDQVLVWDRFLEEMFQRLRPHLRPGSETDLRASVVQLYAGLLMATMHQALFEPFSRLDMTDAGDLEIFVDRLISHFMR